MPTANFHPIAPDGDVDLVLQPAEQQIKPSDRQFTCIPTSSKLHFQRSAEDHAPCSNPTSKIALNGRWMPKTWAYTQNSSESKPAKRQSTTTPKRKASGISKGKTASTSSDDCVRIRVSSKHLILASSYFKRNLESGMSESHALNSDGRVDLPMEDGDPEIMLIVMNVIHGRTRKVPRHIDFDMLTRMAILVDYLECHESIEPFSDMWINNLISTMTVTYSKALIQWLCISLVFRKDIEFKALTCTAIRQANGPIDTLGLPIRESVVEMINRHRDYAIHRLLLALEDLLDDFRLDRTACAFECNAIRYGTLTKELSSRGLLFPRPTTPFIGLNFENIVTSVGNIQDPQRGEMPTEPKPNHYSYSHSSAIKPNKVHSCQLKSLITPVIQLISANVNGLSLSDFIRAQ